MTRFPNADSHAKFDASEKRRWDEEHRTRNATNLTEVLTIVHDLVKIKYEDEAQIRFIHYSFEFYLSKLTDFQVPDIPEPYMRSSLIAKALHEAMDAIAAQLFDEDEMSWFKRELDINGDRCSLGIDIAMKMRF